MNRQHSNVETVDLWVFIAGAIGFLSDVSHGGNRLILTVEENDIGVVISMDDYNKLLKATNNEGESYNV